MGRRALVACLAGLLALTPAGCQDLPSERAIPAATLVVRQFSQTFSRSLPHPARDERVDVRGEVRGELVVRPTAGGLRLRLDGALEADGTGRSTGRAYRVAGEFSRRILLESFDPPLSLEVPVEAAITSPGEPDRTLSLVLAVTLGEEDGRLGEILVDIRPAGSG